MTSEPEYRLCAINPGVNPHLARMDSNTVFQQTVWFAKLTGRIIHQANSGTVYLERWSQSYVL